MYNGSSYCIKPQYDITENILSTSAVKQSCTISPTLSNLFQNDIHQSFDKSCDPVELDGTTLNSVSWADDLFMFSISWKGLYCYLEKPKEYCVKWQLNVNISKTKVMIMSKGNRKGNEFTFNGEELEFVNTYKYLGMLISKNGNIQQIVEDRVKKTKRATFALKQALGTSVNTSPKLAMSLYEKQIEPILRYGCPLWGLPESNCSIRIF